MKYTPWILHEDEPGSCWVEDIRGVTIAYDLTREIAEALIAAPDLLEALKECKVALAGARAILNDIAPIKHALELAGAEIAKAGRIAWPDQKTK